MTKVFLYLYPIKEFVSEYIPYINSSPDNLDYYEKSEINVPLEVLNETIDKR